MANIKQTQKVLPAEKNTALFLNVIINERLNADDFQGDVCSICGKFTGVLIQIPFANNGQIICKGCLDKLIDLINETYQENF